MRVAIYDKNPGKGAGQWFLALSWAVGCFLHKLFGKLDAYHAATSWEEGIQWLAVQPKPLLSIQYWGHGSPGTVWLAGKSVDRSLFQKLIPCVKPESVLWFRTCSTLQGQAGYDFSKYMTDLLQCTVAGHTRIIGVFQGGLHTRKPNQGPTWDIRDNEFQGSQLATWGLKWGPKTILCLRATIPKGW